MEILNLIIILILSLPIVWGDEDFLSKAHQKDLALRNYKQVLEDVEIPKSDSKTPDGETLLPPKYMIDLYYQYTEDEIPSTLNGNMTISVRCIMSKIKRNNLIFDLISLSPKEFISSAELHIYQRKNFRKKHLRIKYSLTNKRLLESSVPKKHLAGTSQLFPTKGWVILDVTNIILASLHKWQSLVASLEGLMPEFGYEKEKYYTLPLEEVVKLGFKPFLIIYSQSNIGFPPRNDQSPKSTPILPKMENNMDFRDSANNGLMGSSHISTYPKEEDDDDKLDNEIPHIPIDYQTQRRMSMYLNRHKERPKSEDVYNIFEDYSDYNDTLDSSATQNIIRRGSTRVVRKRSAAFDTDKVDKSESLPSYRFSTPAPTYDTSDNLLPIQRSWWKSDITAPAGMTNKHNKRKYKRTRKSKHNNKPYRKTKIADLDFDFTQIDGSSSTSHQSSCALQKLSVNSISWSSQIIAPSSFPFNYCTGNCYSTHVGQPYFYNSVCEQQNSGLDSSNSNNYKDNETSDTSCCIPTEKKRLSILFVDKHNTIVLKSYPNATITACSCE